MNRELTVQNEAVVNGAQRLLGRSPLLTIRGVAPWQKQTHSAGSNLTGYSLDTPM